MGGVLLPCLAFPNVSPSVRLSLPPRLRILLRPLRYRRRRRWLPRLCLRSLPIRPIRDDCRGDPEGPRGRGEGIPGCREQAQRVHGGREEEVRGLRGCTEEGCGGRNRQGEGARREAGSICLWLWSPWLRLPIRRLPLVWPWLLLLVVSTCTS